MKKILYLFITISLLFFSCSKLDNIEDELDRHSARIEALELLCSKINSDISALNKLVEVLKNNDYVTSVTTIMKDGKVVGYTLTFDNSSAVVVYNTDTNSSAPVIGMKQDGGKWYWTLNDEWLKDSSGNKVAVDTVTPSLKIDDGKWYISCDGGKTWSETKVKTGSPIFKEIYVDDEIVKLILSDGTEITFPIHLTDYFDLPSSILQFTDDLGKVVTGDTMNITLRVNPSDYKLKLENLDLMVSHDIYSCYTQDSIPQNPVFDESVKSEFRIIGLEADAGNPGNYNISLKAEGEGNYIDIAKIYVLVKIDDKDVCSSSYTKVEVIPSISSGINIQSVPQSLYNVDADKKCVIKSSPKPYILGLWSNLYVNDKGQVIPYDRSSVKVSGISEELHSSVSDSCFQDLGYVKIIPDFTSDFWQNALKLESSEDFIQIENQAITLSQGTYSEALNFNFKAYFAALKIDELTYSITGDQIKPYEPIIFNYFTFAKKTGLYDIKNSKRLYSIKESLAHTSEHCFTYDKLEVLPDSFCFSIYFQQVKTGDKYRHYTLYSYNVTTAQGSDGKIKQLPSELSSDFTLIQTDILQYISLTE